MDTDMCQQMDTTPDAAVDTAACFDTVALPRSPTLPDTTISLDIGTSPRAPTFLHTIASIDTTAWPRSPALPDTTTSLDVGTTPRTPTFLDTTAFIDTTASLDAAASPRSPPPPDTTASLSAAASGNTTALFGIAAGLSSGAGLQALRNNAKQTAQASKDLQEMFRKLQNDVIKIFDAQTKPDMIALSSEWVKTVIQLKDVFPLFIADGLYTENVADYFDCQYFAGIHQASSEQSKSCL